MKPILFHISDYDYLANNMLLAEGFEAGEVEVKTFPDGERYQHILTPVEGRQVVLVGGTISDAATLELFDLACSLVQNGADKLTMVVPYYGYSTMERAVQPGEVVTAKTRALLFSAIPRSNKGNSLLLFDLHSEGLPYYFENSLRAKHVYCKDLILSAAREYGGENFVLGSTDAGRAKWVESLARELHVQPAFVLKRRISGAETEVTAINADVSGKTVILYDDMIRSGGSLIHAAEAYKAAGADKLYAITTHGLFIGGGLARLRDCGLFEKVMTTDSHALTQTLDDDFVDVRSLAGLIRRQLFDI